MKKEQSLRAVLFRLIIAPLGVMALILTAIIQFNVNLSQNSLFQGLSPVFSGIGIFLFIFALGLTFAVLVQNYIAGRIVRPIAALENWAKQMTQGEFQPLPEAVGDYREISNLAKYFDQTASAIQERNRYLEEQVAARTQRLETVTELSEQINAVLNIEELFKLVVNEIKIRFNYYHAHIYMLDESERVLTVVEGAGEVGTEMKAQRHSIAINAPASLVARCARNGEIIIIDNVRESPDWLPNPLLPDTYAEIAVPIVVEGGVVGVLDVQQNIIAGLDESDASLLRYLANQIAIAIRNINLLNQVDAALKDARATELRYAQQAWQSEKGRTRPSYHYAVSGQRRLPETVIARLKQSVAAEDASLIIANPQTVDTEAEVDYSAVVAPIKLQNQVIGAMQVYQTAQGERRQWTEQEVTFIQAIADQVAQSAENLRLFDETRRRAAREQAIREITDKLRAAPTVESLVKIATHELGERLAATHTKIDLGIETKQSQLKTVKMPPVLSTQNQPANSEELSNV